MRPKLLTATLLSLLLADAKAHAQGPPPPIDTIQVEVNSLLLPVIVRDAHGNPVDNLRKEDFKVLDQGKPRPIVGFTIDKALSTTASEPTNPTPAASQQSTPPTPSAAPSRFIVFLFDDRHFTVSDLEQARQTATRVFEQPLPPNDRALILSFHGVNSGISRDPAVLKSTILKLKADERDHHEAGQCPDIDYYAADQILNMHSDVEYKIAQEKTALCNHTSSQALQDPSTLRTLDTLLRTAATRTLEIGNQDAHDSLLYIWQVLHSMGSVPGQRTLVLVSPGFLTVDQSAMRLQSQIVNLAASINVTISALDVRGLSSPVMSASQSGVGSTYALQTGQNIQSQADAQRANTAVMADLADSAGGAFIHNTNDLEGGFKTLLTAPESLYLLELSLQDVKQNGTYHSLKVEVTQPNLKVQARKGYFAPQAAKK